MWEPWEKHLVEVLVLVILVSAGVWIYRLFQPCNANEITDFYGYTDADGPNQWREKFNTKGHDQSPVNLLSVGALMLTAEEPLLCFSPEYQSLPVEVKIINDSNNVVLYAGYSNGKRPFVCGGPLSHEYKFHNMRFRWGPNDEEGSEHMIDMKRYAMEVQVAYNKCPCKFAEGMNASRGCSMLIISYIFEVTCTENPYLEPILHGLQFIQYPCRTTCVRPFPLSLLAPVFNRKYFSYVGSLSHPPCTEGVRWIVQPEPLTVSPEQVEEFRRLIGFSGRIYSNVRPVQTINNRCIYFYD